MAAYSRPTSTTSSSSGRRRRAARGDRGLRRAPVGLVCKSLLGKAHTVMAEGRHRRGDGQRLDDATTGRSTSATPCAAGQYVNNWRMAELHAQGSARPGVELRSGARCSTAPRTAAFSQRNFRRPQVSAPCPRRRPHRPRDDPHAPGPRHPPGHRRAHGMHGADAAEGRRPRRRARWVTSASAGGSWFSRPRPSCWPPGGIGRAFKITSNSWECTGDGHSLAYHAGAELIDMEFVQFHPTGMVWPPSVCGILVTEGVRGEGGMLPNNEGRASCSTTFPNFTRPRRRTTRRRLAYTRRDKKRGGRPELLTRDHVARCIVREIKAGGAARTAASSSTSPGSKRESRRAPSTSSGSCRACTTSSKNWRTSTSRRSPMEVGPTTHYHGRRAGGRRHADVVRARTLRRGRMRGGHQRREPPGRQFSPTCSCSANARERIRRALRQVEGGKLGFSRRRSSRRARRWSLSNGGRRGAGEGPYAIQYDLQEMMQDSSASCAGKTRCCARVGGNPKLVGGRNGSWCRGIANTIPAGTRRSTWTNMLTVSEAITRSALERKESRGAHFRDDFPNKETPPPARRTSWSRCATTAMRVRRVADLRDARGTETGH